MYFGKKLTKWERKKRVSRSAGSKKITKPA